jgi:hypothetical protein
MSRLDELRAEAAKLEASAEASGCPIQHSAALDEVAKRHGFNNWRAARAILNAADDVLPNLSNELRTRRYESKRWGFSIDVPLSWNAFPTDPTNSPFEVLRILSGDIGRTGMIIFREPRDPVLSPPKQIAAMQALLEKAGFGNFAVSEALVGASMVPVLDFDKPTEGGLWSVRHHVIEADTLRYVVSFGSSHWKLVLPLVERLAASFTFDPVAWGEAEPEVEDLVKALASTQAQLEARTLAANAPEADRKN